MIAPTLSAPRTVLWLLRAYLAVSWATVVMIVYLSIVAPTLVTPPAWFRGVIVAATSVLTLIYARKAIQRRPRALLRLRIVAVVVLVAIVVVVFVLNLPTWMVYEQLLCGALLLAVVILAFSTNRASATTDRTLIGDE